VWTTNRQFSSEAEAMLTRLNDLIRLNDEAAASTICTNPSDFW